MYVSPICSWSPVLMPTHTVLWPGLACIRPRLFNLISFSAVLVFSRLLMDSNTLILHKHWSCVNQLLRQVWASEEEHVFEICYPISTCFEICYLGGEGRKNEIKSLVSKSARAMLCFKMSVSGSLANYAAKCFQMKWKCYQSTNNYLNAALIEWFTKWVMHWLSDSLIEDSLIDDSLSE